MEPPTGRYDERIHDVDASIIAAVAARQQISNGQPGFPKPADLKQWAAQYGVPVSIQHQVFSVLFRWHVPEERVEPDRFERFVPIMASEERESLLVMVPYVRQYSNCSVVSVHVECRETVSPPVHMTLQMEGFECRLSSGGGNERHWTHEFIVTPRIRDGEETRLGFTVQVESRPRETELERKPIAPTTIRVQAAP